MTAPEAEDCAEAFFRPECWNVETPFSRREIGGLNIRGVFQTLGKALVASAVAAPVVWFGAIAIAGLSDRFGNFLYLAALTIVFLLFAWTYYFVAKLLKMPETKYAEAAARRDKKASGS